MAEDGDPGAPPRETGAAEGRAFRGRADLRFALMAGPTAWRDPTAPDDPAELMAAVMLLLGSAGSATLLLTVADGLTLHTGEGRARIALALWFLVLLGVLVWPTASQPLGRRSRQLGPAWRAAGLRVLLMTVAMGLWIALLGPVTPAGSWGLGTVVGSDAALAAWSLGITPAAWSWWRRFQLSSVHVGVVTAIALALLVARTEATTVLIVYATVQVLVLSGAFTAATLDRRRTALVRRDEDLRAEAIDAEHRRLADWLHDDISSALRSTRLRLAAGSLTPDRLDGELDALDHRIRLRQLDEILASGSAQLAEIIQPYVRIAQSQGVRIAEVPTFDQAAAVVDARTGRLVQRTLGVLVPNAIGAGARTLSSRLDAEPGAFVVEIEDDAGGFDLAAAPAGRGLDRLRRELAGGGITVVATRSGSRVQVRVPKAEGSGR